MATSQISRADFTHGLVYFAFGGSLLRVVHGTDALANLLGEEAQPEARRQHAFQDAHLSVLGQRDQPPTQLGNLGVVCLGWEAHGSSLLRVGPNFMGVRRLDLVRQPGALRSHLERTTAMCAAQKRSSMPLQPLAEWRVPSFVGHWLAARMDFNGSGRYRMGSNGGGKTLSYRVFALQVGVALKKSPNTFCGFKPRRSPNLTNEDYFGSRTALTAVVSLLSARSGFRAVRSPRSALTWLEGRSIA